MRMSNRVPRVVWCRWQGADAAVAEALANICRCENRPTMRLKDAATGEAVVRCYCDSRAFDLAYVPNARREAEAKERAAAVVELHQARIAEAQAAAATVKVRCPHYALIRKFYAVATDAGLDTKADGRCREALSKFFGFTIWSRADLAAEHWDLAAAGVKAGSLAW